MKPPEVNKRVAIGRVASLGPSGESAEAEPMPSPLVSEPCHELLDALNSAFAVVLINAQALDGKLPSYSRAKRYIHEIERSAQRGGALLKRWLDRVPAQAACSCDEGLSERVPPVAERTTAVANQGPTLAGEGVLALASPVALAAAPAFLPQRASAHRTV